MRLSFAHRELFQRTKEHQLILSFVIKLNEKIVENQLRTSSRNVKCVVLLPIVRITSHFYVPSYLLCIVASISSRNRASFHFLNSFL